MYFKTEANNIGERVICILYDAFIKKMNKPEGYWEKLGYRFAYESDIPERPETMKDPELYFIDGRGESGYSYNFYWIDRLN